MLKFKHSIVILFFLLLLLSAFLSSSQNLRGSYKLPIIPLGISVDRNGVEFFFEPEIVTPIGTFSIGVTERFRNDTDYRRSVYKEKKIKYIEKDLVVIVRDPRVEQDSAFIIKEGQEFNLECREDIKINFKNGVLLIDLSYAKEYRIDFKGRGVPQDIEHYHTKLMKITSEPTNANVYVDNKYKGKTPVNTEIYHDAIISLDFNSQYRPIEELVHLYEKKNEYHYDFIPYNPQVSISSYPKESDVFINNKFVGTTPFKHLIPSGEYNIEFRHQNYFSEQDILYVKDREDREYHKTLQTKNITAFGFNYGLSNSIGFEFLIRGQSSLKGLAFGINVVPHWFSKKGFTGLDDKEKEWNKVYEEEPIDTFLKTSAKTYFKLGVPMFNHRLYVTGGIGFDSKSYKYLYRCKYTYGKDCGTNPENVNFFSTEMRPLSPKYGYYDRKLIYSAGLYVHFDFLILTGDYCFNRDSEDDLRVGILYNFEYKRNKFRF